MSGTVPCRVCGAELDPETEARAVALYPERAMSPAVTLCKACYEEEPVRVYAVAEAVKVHQAGLKRQQELLTRTRARAGHLAHAKRGGLL
ncbi:MAG TPA: hypothetical protein VGN26_04040 [Armatimonadota bacterium]|jgi:hypothetical protein